MMIPLWPFLAATRVVNILDSRKRNYIFRSRYGVSPFAHLATQGWPLPTAASKTAGRSPPDTGIGDTNNIFSSSPDAPNLDSFSWADELARVAKSAKFTRLPDMTDLDKRAKLEDTIRYCSNRDLLGATVTEREGRERSNVTEDPGD